LINFVGGAPYHGAVRSVLWQNVVGVVVIFIESPSNVKGAYVAGSRRGQWFREIVIR